MAKKKNSPLATLINILSFVLLLAVIFYFGRHIRYLEKYIMSLGIFAPLVIIGLYGLLAPTPITTDPLTILNGVLYGPVLGILISWMGNNVAALVEYYIGSHIGHIANFKEKKKHLPFGLGILPVDSAWFLVLGRLIPGYGGKIISIMGGIYHVPLKKYLWTSALTNLLGSILLALAGGGLIRSLLGF